MRQIPAFRSRREVLLAALALPAAMLADDGKQAPKVAPKGPVAAPKPAASHGAGTQRKPVNTRHEPAAGHGPADPHAPRPVPHAEDVLKELMAGNKRFVAGQSKHPRATLARVRETSSGQHPYAVVLTCADSRVPPEIFLDQGIGDIFTVRVAGNVANNDEIASAEYAVSHFGTPVCVVIGHTECGAVSAVVNGDEVSADIGRMVVHISEAFQKTKRHNPSLSGKNLVNETARVNVWESVEDMIKGSEVIARKVRTGDLQIVGGIYNLDTGKVDWMGAYPGALSVLH
ncbi:MAG: carbonic anhydrase [Acidobacteria bacterium]|nr:carbonic anhydrase [Acidobacteriota bacterium]